MSAREPLFKPVAIESLRPTLADDPYRSLAGDLRRAGGFAKDTTPFSEFLWADFLRKLIKRKAVEGDFPASLRKALSLAKKRRPTICPVGAGEIPLTRGRHG